MENISLPHNWDADLYQSQHNFVWKFGEDLLSLLNPQPGELILDLGCGTGELTAKIGGLGVLVMGIDNSPEMITKAQLNYPNLLFNIQDARTFPSNQSFDAVFSNAVLHWIPESAAVIKCVYQALKPGGRFVAEFGARNNIKAITTALEQVLEEMGIKAANPWYFPSIGEYSNQLEKHGFDVNYAVILDRPTVLNDGEAGLNNWLWMFASGYIYSLIRAIQSSKISTEDQLNQKVSQVINRVEASLKSQLYQSGNWVADYRRIRIMAVKNK